MQRVDDKNLFHGDLVNSARILYTPTDFARANLNHLQEIGYLKATKRHVSSRENLASYLFFMVEEGEGRLTFDGEEYFLKKGDCAFIDCRKSYSHECSDNLWSLRWVHFNGPCIDGIYDKYCQRGGRPCFEEQEKMGELWQSLYVMASSDDYIRDMKINELLTSLLTALMGISWNPENEVDSNISSKRQNLTEIKDYLEEHFSEKITLDELAENFFINKFYLTRIFRNQFGMSINSYLLQYRITKAKQLLRFTDKTAEEIGLECGLGAANYFSRTFKKVEGITPGEYRKSW